MNNLIGNPKTWAALVAAVGLGSVGCGGDDVVEQPSCEVTPAEWSPDGFDTNAAEALALRAAIANLTGTIMNTAEQSAWGNTPTTPPSTQDLIDAYEAGSPSIADVTPPALDALVRQAFADWSEAMAEDPASYLFIDADGLAWVATGAGGVHERPPADDGTRRFRAYSSSGVEQRQIVDKGLFVGALYNYALGLTEGTITPETIHAIAAAWGSNPELVAMPAEGEPANDDSAAYAQTMGLYDETAAALTAAQAYAGDELCTAERDAALVDVFRLWEEAMFARGTFYGSAPMREPVLDPSTPETILGPLHGASEGYGLMAGMVGMPDPAEGPLAGGARISSDADIEDALGALGVNLDDLSAGTTGEMLVEAPADYEAGYDAEFKDIVQTLFGWDDEVFAEYSIEPIPTTN